jgi:hypothetical protein
MRGMPSRRRRRAREGVHPLMHDRARAGDDARIGRIRARDASSIRWIRAAAGVAEGGAYPSIGDDFRRAP